MERGFRRIRQTCVRSSAGNPHSGPEMDSGQTHFEARMQRLRSVLRSLAESLIPPGLRAELDASDLVQQTLMEAWEQSDRLVSLDDRQLFGWLRTALRHNTLDAVKHLSTQKNDAERRLRMSELEGSFARLEDILHADGTSPSEVLQRAEQTTRLLMALQELPTQQRDAVMLKHLKGYSLQRVAETLHISEAAAAGLLHRGRKHLMDRLGSIACD